MRFHIDKNQPMVIKIRIVIASRIGGRALPLVKTFYILREVLVTWVSTYVRRKIFWSIKKKERIMKKQECV